MARSKSTLMTMEEESRLRWKKASCSALDFMISQRRALRHKSSEGELSRLLVSSRRVPRCSGTRSLRMALPVAGQLARLQPPIEDRRASLNATHLTAQAMHLLVGSPAVVAVATLVGDAGRPDGVSAAIGIA